MKITEETKLKELIPEGYEYDPSRLNLTDDSNCSYEYIAIPVKQKPKKDLEWYVINYAEKIKNYSAILTNFRFYALAMAANLSSDFINNNYDEIPFEFRIGLFKYICDDLDVQWTLVLEYCVEKPYLDRIKTITNLLPEEFINSLIYDTNRSK